MVPNPFGARYKLKQAMQRVGVMDTSSSYFLNEADRIIL
jgi:hypothetical protein